MKFGFIKSKSLRGFFKKSMEIPENYLQREPSIISQLENILCKSHPRVPEDIIQ